MTTGYSESMVCRPPFEGWTEPISILSETVGACEPGIVLLTNLTELSCADFHCFSESVDRFSEIANLMVNRGLMLKGGEVSHL